MLRLKIFFLFIFLSLVQASAQQVTISNNLLYDATLTPNLRIGLRLAPHWSVGLTGGYRPWPTNDVATRKYRHLLVSPSLRYWTDSVNVHHFFGVNLIYSHYNVGGITFPFGLYKSVRDERREGDLGALGIFYGYSWPLGRHWNLEALIGAAVGYTKYNRYECGHCGTLLSKDRKWFAMPQAALNIVFNIPGRPAKRVEVVPEEEPVILIPAAPVPEPFKAAAHAVAPETGVAGKLQASNPMLRHISEYRPYDRTQILRRDKDALYVHFSVGKSDVQEDFRDNHSVLDRIINVTRQVMKDDKSSIKIIQIVGLSSVDGAVAANERLANNRAKALQDYIQGKLDIPDSLFDTTGGGEAWTELRDQLEEVADKDSQHADMLRKAIEVIDSETDLNLRERKLRKLNGGQTWNYIRENILSDQRNAGFIRVYYDCVPDVAAATINEASELLTTDCSDCHHEALRLLLTVRNDERAQNALGLAYWLCGQKEESLDCFRRAAANGNADAAENLKQLEKQINNSNNQQSKQR